MIKEAETELARVRTEIVRLRAAIRAANEERDAKVSAAEEEIRVAEAREQEMAVFLRVAKTLSAAQSAAPVPSSVDHASAQLRLPEPNIVAAHRFPVLPNAPERSGRRPRGTMIAAVQLCVDILKETGKPWHTRDLVPELARRGLDLGGANAVLNLSNKLGQSDLVRSHVKLGWHLQEWPDYPDPSKERIAILRAQLERNAEKRRARSGIALQVKPEFEGKGLPELAVEVLTKSGEAMTNTQIASILEKDGFPFIAEDHAVAVQGALRRRHISVEDVIRVPPRSWGLKQWYSEQELGEFARIAERPKSKATQKVTMQTRAGVRSALERGVRFGRPPQFADEDVTLAMQMFTDGASVGDVAAAFEVSTGQANRWRNKALAEKE